MTNIYYINIQKDYDFFLTYCESYLSLYEKNRLHSCMNKKKKPQIIVSALLKRYVFESIYRIPKYKQKMRFNPNGKPYFVGENIHFSVSNTSDYIVIAVSDDKEIGVDIEKKRVLFHEAIKPFFHKDEFDLIRLNNTEFTKTWTRKEAYIKCAGISWNMLRKNQVSVVGDNIVIDKSMYHLQSFDFNKEYIISVCVKNFDVNLQYDIYEVTKEILLKNIV